MAHNARPVKTREIQNVALLYGVRSSSIHSCASVYVKNAAYRIITNRGSILVKPFHGSRITLQRLSRRVHHLQSKGFRSMPKWLTTRNGRLWVRSNGKLFYATEWVNGHPLGQDDRDTLKAGVALGELHRLTENMAPPVASKMTLVGIRQLQQQDREFRRALQVLVNRSSEEGVWFREYGEQCVRLADGAWTTLREHGNLRFVTNRQLVRPSFIHGDFTRPNVMVSESGIRIIDWDRMRAGSAVLELMKAVTNTTDFRTSGMEAFLRGYESKRPLTAEERLLMIQLFRLPREAWYAAKRLAKGRKSAVFPIVRRSWSARLHAIEWLDNWGKSEPPS